LTLANKFPIYKQSLKYVVDIYTDLSKLDETVTKIPSFNEFTSLMKVDKKINALQGKLVGTVLSSTIVKNETACILNFLQQLYIKNPEYEQKLFDQEYAYFEYLFKLN